MYSLYCGSLTNANILGKLDFKQNYSTMASFGLSEIWLVRLLFSARTVFFSYNISDRTVFSASFRQVSDQQTGPIYELLSLAKAFIIARTLHKWIVSPFYFILFNTKLACLSPFLLWTLESRPNLLVLFDTLAILWTFHDVGGWQYRLFPFRMFSEGQWCL